VTDQNDPVEKALRKTQLTPFWRDTFRTAIEGTTPDEGVLIWSLGGASFAVRTPEAMVYLDPFFGGPPPDSEIELFRTTAIPIDPCRIGLADAVFISHEHYDHCHPDSLLMMADGTDASFYGPASAVKLMRQYGLPNDRIRELKPGDRTIVKDVAVTAWPAYDPIEPDAVTYVIEAGGVTLFFAGDSAAGPAFREIAAAKALDIAMLAFGRTWYMGEAEMLDAAAALNPKLLLPYHWELWRGHTGDPLELGRLVERNKPKFEVCLLLLGDHLHYRPGGRFTKGE